MPEHTALLVVHGIGKQEPLQTLTGLAEGLRRVAPDGVPPKVSNGTEITVGGRAVRLYEVYWADLHKDPTKTKGAFDLNEAQSLTWFPLFNWRRGNYVRGRYSALRMLWCLALPFCNFLLVWSYFGAGFLAQILFGSKGKRPARADESAATTALRKTVGTGTTLTALDTVLDEFAGDVTAYVNSAHKAFYREAKAPPVPEAREHLFANAMTRFYDQLVAASSADGCREIQVVAHSLGSVVSYHALSGFRFEIEPAPRAAAIRAARAKVTRLYTIGCPLEKIRFFWPRITPGGGAFSDLRLRWDNLVSFFDPVSGRVRTFDDLGEVKNHPLLGGGFISAHVVYERSPIFLGALTEGLCGTALPLKQGFQERLSSMVRLIGETLLTPVVLIIMLACGVMLFALVAILVPWLASLVARIFVGPETYGPIVDRVSLVFLGLMVLTFVIAPRNRASKVHRLFWLPPS